MKHLILLFLIGMSMAVSAQKVDSVYTKYAAIKNKKIIITKVVELSDQKTETIKEFDKDALSKEIEQLKQDTSNINRNIINMKQMSEQIKEQERILRMDARELNRRLRQYENILSKL